MTTCIDCDYSYDFGDRDDADIDDIPLVCRRYPPVIDSTSETPITGAMFEADLWLHPDIRAKNIACGEFKSKTPNFKERMAAHKSS